MKNRKKIDNNSSCILKDGSPMAYREAFNILRTNVLFSMPGDKCKTVGITSGMSGEGKSTVITNLAIALGQIGKNVLIIDADMRKGSVASALGIVNKPGLSEFLVGEIEINELVKRMNRLNVNVIVSGTKPPDTSALYETERMEKMMALLKNEFDFILFDMPPISMFSDTRILSKYLDGFILTVRHDVSEREEIRAVINQIKQVDSRILGYVYNDVDIKKGKYGYGKYGKYGKYGYNY